MTLKCCRIAENVQRNIDKCRPRCDGTIDYSRALKVCLNREMSGVCGGHLSGWFSSGGGLCGDGEQARGASVRAFQWLAFSGNLARRCLFGLVSAGGSFMLRVYPVGAFVLGHSGSYRLSCKIPANGQSAAELR